MQIQEKLTAQIANCIQDVLKPKGVAALPRPNILADRFMIMALIPGCSAGIPGNRRVIRGLSERASTRNNPASCATFITPNQKAMIPTSPMANVTAVFALSKEAWVTPSIFPEKAPHKTEDSINISQIQLSNGDSSHASKFS